MRLAEVPPTCRCEPARCTVRFLALRAGEREYRAWEARNALRSCRTAAGHEARREVPAQLVGPLIDGSEAHLPQLGARHPACFRAARGGAQVHWVEPVPSR